MTTPYKPVRDHVPLNLQEEIRRLEARLDANFAELIKIVRGNKPLDEDEDVNRAELDELRDQFFRALFQFTAACDARPIRSVNSLLATLRHIEQNPRDFCGDHTKFDPEAVDRVFRHFGGRMELARFELGEASLVPSEVSLAAAFAIVEITQDKLKSKSRRGRPADEILLNFAFKASILFQASGGTPTSTKDGSFWRFVELLREIVLDAAQNAGSSLTIESVVRKGSV